MFLAYKQYPVVPIQLTVSKRLSQCLHPNLPSGVHLKALSVYTAIFDRIGSKGLASNLLVYSSSLFPLMGYASMSVRPHLLAIYEQYYLPLGDGLMPALHGFVLGLLPGLEDESEHTDRLVCIHVCACCNVYMGIIVCIQREGGREGKRERELCMYVLGVGVCWGRVRGREKLVPSTYYVESFALLCMHVYVCL